MNGLWLQDQIYSAARDAFSPLLDAHAHEGFYAFALYTDSSVMSIGASANSLAKLEEKVAVELEVEEKTEQNIAFYKWSSSEWAYEGHDSELFFEINRQLRESSQREYFSAFRERVLDAMTNAFSRLVSEDFFKNSCAKYAGEGVFCFITITDDDSEDIENSSAQRINAEPIFRAFLKRYQS